MVFCLKHPLSKYLVISLLVCFTYDAALGIVEVRDATVTGSGIAVTDNNKKKLLNEFVFNCLENPWIMDPPDNKCIEQYTYLMLFNQEGKIVEYSKETTIWTAEKANLKIPTDNSDLSFLFRLVWDRDDVRILSSDMEVLTVNTNGELVMVDKDKSCPLNDVDDEILQLACESRGDCGPPTTNLEPSTKNATMLARGCLEGRWKLVKKGIFLEIQNSKNNEEKLKFKKGILSLDNLGELFTGKDTNFRTGYALDKSNESAPKPYTDILDNAYGDVVIKFQDRNGHPQESFLCDYMWDQKDSDLLCSERNFTSSIPTYDGVYSVRKLDFAISGVECDGRLEAGFAACSFKVGENKEEMILQENMKTFGGKGYGCEMTSQRRDIGGVICGTFTQISHVQKKETKCVRELEASGTPGEMFSLKQQVRKYSDKMSEEQHWSEFLLPIPLSVTLLASVILASTSVRPITLEQPINGFQFLKYSSLEGNLIFVSNSITDSFFISNTEMIGVKLEAETIHRSLGKIVEYAYRSRPNVKSVKRYLKKMTESATQQVTHVDTIIQSFDNTNNILDELLGALGDTDSLTDQQRGRITQYVEINTEKNKKKRERLEKQKLQFEKVKENAKKAENIFFNRTEQMLSERCIDNGATTCNSCEYTKGRKKDGDLCAIDRREVCDDWQTRNGECLQDYCCKWHGIENHAICADRCCKTHAQIKECFNYVSVCDEYEMHPAGDYCFDSNKNESTAMCGKCDHIEDVKEAMEKMSKFTSQLMQNVLNAQPNSKELNEFLQTILESLVDLSTKVQGLQDHDNDASIKETKSTATTATKSSKVQNSSPAQEETQSPTTNESSKVESTPQEPSTSSPTKEKSRKTKLNKDMLTAINVMEPTLQTSELLWSDRNKDEKKVKEFCRLVLTVIQQIRKEIKYPQTQAKSPSKSLTEYQELLKIGNRIYENLEMKANNIPTIEATGVTSLAKEFLSYQESQVKRLELGLDIRSLSDTLESSIEEILTKELKGSDLDAVLVYLRETSTQLTHIKKLWSDLRLFFVFVASVVKRTTRHTSDINQTFNINQTFEQWIDINSKELSASETYAAIDELILDEDTLRELKESTVEAMAYNSYTYRIAKFYNGLMAGSGGGLLGKLTLVGNDRHRFKGPNVDKAELNKYKTYLKNEAKATQAKIKDDISHEEHIIEKRLTENIMHIENQFACALEDSTYEEDTKTYLKLLAITRAAQKEPTPKEEITARNSARTEGGLESNPEDVSTRTIQTPVPNLDVDVDTRYFSIDD